MIHETSRLGEHSINETFENKQNLDIPAQMTLDDAKPSQEVEAHLSYFFIELFICSLLLWSLLFMSKSEIGVEAASYMENILEEKCSIEMVQAFEVKLEEAIKQII